MKADDCPARVQTSCASPALRLGLASVGLDRVGFQLRYCLCRLLVLLLSQLLALEPVAAIGCCVSEPPAAPPNGAVVVRVAVAAPVLFVLSVADPPPMRGPGLAPAQPLSLAAASAPLSTFSSLDPPGARSGAEPPLPALFQQALEASRAGRFDLALPLWDQVLKVAPKDAAAWSNRGNVQLALGDPLAAIADQDHSLLLEPDNADPHLNRGTAEEALGRWDAAAADYSWILERDPADASALYNLGNVEGSLGHWQAARERFDAAAAARPGFAMARSSAALAAFQLGDLAAAERELRSLIRRYPLFADARAGLTALLWQRGASGEAESHWAAASGLDPRYRQSEWLLAIRRWPPGPVQALERFLQLSS
jgi:tetratricopeptide (TPR) repeat protein